MTRVTPTDSAPRTLLPQINEAGPLYLKRELAINWPLVATRRARVLRTVTDMPKYLVLREVQALLDAVLHQSTHLLIDTLWHSGARMSEVLALTRASFTLAVEARDSRLYLKTLKKRRVGRPALFARKNAAAERKVPLSDPVCLDALRRYLATFDLNAHERLFNFTRQTANNRIKRVFEAADGVPLEPSAHTLRHFFAINALLHGTPLRILQRWLGHEGVATAVIHTNVMATETEHFRQAVVQFQENPPGLTRPVYAALDAIPTNTKTD